LISLIYDTVLFIYESFVFGSRIWWWRLNLYYFLEYLWGFHRIANKEAHSLPHDKDNYICGETPCITFRTILRNLEIKPGDLFIDLGCGRGQTVYFARLLFDMKAKGYDLISTFILKAGLINCFLKINNVEFINDNILNVDLGAAKAVYIVPTTFTADFMEKINKKLLEVHSGSYIISVSRPLQEEHYELIRKESLLYSWGRTAVYYYVRK